MRWRMVVVVIAVLLAPLGVGVGNVAYTNHVDERRVADQARSQQAAREAARRASCELIVAFDELFKESPPTTPAGEQVAALWARYRVELKC